MVRHKWVHLKWALHKFMVNQKLVHNNKVYNMVFRKMTSPIRISDNNQWASQKWEDRNMHSQYTVSPNMETQNMQLLR